MSWSASGKASADGLTLSFVSPPEENMDDAPKAQLSFMRDFVTNAFVGGHLEGSYNVSLYGHANDTATSDYDRKTLGFSLSPVNDSDTP